MPHHSQILGRPEIGYDQCVPVPLLCRRTSTAEREIEHVTEHAHVSPDWPNAIAQPIDESCECRPVRFGDITITPASPGMDLRHAATPLPGEATNPIGATRADAGGGGAARGEVGGTSPRPTDAPITPPKRSWTAGCTRIAGLSQG